ncbi:MAG: response regulator transcription factor [Nitrospiraceae bacterium]
MEEVDDVSFDHRESMAAPHAGPGIMLLTASLQLLYRDRRAWELCEQIIRCQNGKRANGVLPPAVACLADQIRKTFQVRTDPKGWEQFQIRRTVNTLHRSVLLCGMGLIDLSNSEKRILIVMNEIGIGAWQDNVIVQAQEKFHLTTRETTVVQHLLKGWTNKEIANEMGVAEQTVKEHCKHILEKTSTTTRTGIVMQVVHCGLQHEPATLSVNLVVPAMTSKPIELVASA